VTFSASRVASTLGAVTLVVATFLPWREPFGVNAWDVYPVLAAALAVTAALALAPRLGWVAAAVALGTLGAGILALRDDLFAVAASGPAVAFVGLATIAAAGVGLRGRLLVAVGALTLALSTFAVWSGGVQGVYFDGAKSGWTAYAPIGDPNDLWAGLDGLSGPGPWLAAAALAALAAGVVTLVRSR
jgi:hypothetical protein